MWICYQECEMIDLALSILFSSLIFVIFKLYSVYRVQTVYAIIVNYFTAFIVGILLSDISFSPTVIIGKAWVPGAASLGILFILIFNLMARTSQQLGVSVASVATKMSFAIPVILGVVLYGEKLGYLKVTGIILAMAAVYFASLKQTAMKVGRRFMLLPVLVFLGSGIIDSSLKFLEEHYVSPEEFTLFSASLFASAALSGLIFLMTQIRRLKINMRNVLGGVALGIPNFFSIYFLLKALQSEYLNSASIFTINNVAIVMFSTLLGIVLFREEISVRNWVGIVMAVLSIGLVALF